MGKMQERLAEMQRERQAEQAQGQPAEQNQPEPNEPTDLAGGEDNVQQQDDQQDPLLNLIAGDESDAEGGDGEGGGESADIFSYFNLDPEEYPDHLREEVEKQLRGADRAIKRKMQEAAEQRKQQSGGEDLQKLREENEKLRGILQNPQALQGLVTATQPQQSKPSLPNPYADGETLDESKWEGDAKEQARMVRALAHDTVAKDFIPLIQQALSQRDQALEKVLSQTSDMTTEQALQPYRHIEAVMNNKEAIKQYARDHQVGIEEAVGALHAKDLMRHAMQSAQKGSKKPQAPQPGIRPGTGMPNRVTSGGTFEEKLTQMLAMPGGDKKLSSMFGSGLAQS